MVAEEAVLTRVIDGKVYRGTKTATGIVYIPDGNSISSSDNTAAVAASGGSSNHSASVAVHNVEEVDSSLTLEEKEAKEKVDAVKALQHSSSSRKVLPSFWLVIKH